MKIIADLHIHSRYARACSKALTVENIDACCEKKGVNVVATGDFTHPEWFRELKEGLEEREKGLYVYKKNSNPKTRFLCSAEIACIYSKGGRVRRLHIIVLAPSLEVVAEINEQLGRIGNLSADGRPILGLDAKRLAEIVWKIDANCFVIPAHAWTPWFAIFGSKSGFDSLQECYEEHADNIHAIETGLSSDPPMNWRVSSLDRITLVSNSDAHSLPNIGREANVFDIRREKLSYSEIVDIISTGDNSRFVSTIEFFPEEGMYHWDGHRDCGVSFAPEETKKIGTICPKCKRPLTIGVDYRVNELADRPFGYAPKGRIPFVKLVELDKIIAEAMNIKSRASKKVRAQYDAILQNNETELDVLMSVPEGQLRTLCDERIADGILRVRRGEVFVSPGFDGQYGKIQIFSDEEKEKKQRALFS